MSTTEQAEAAVQAEVEAQLRGRIPYSQWKRLNPQRFKALVTIKASQLSRGQAATSKESFSD